MASNRELQIGDMVEVTWLESPIKLTSIVPIMDIKEMDQFKQYLVYYIEGDGPFPNWKIKENLRFTGESVDINSYPLCIRIREFLNEENK